MNYIFLRIILERFFDFILNCFNVGNFRFIYIFYIMKIIFLLNIKVIEMDS